MASNKELEGSTLFMIAQSGKTINLYCKMDTVSLEDLKAFLEVHVRTKSLHRGHICGVQLQVSRNKPTPAIVPIDNLLTWLKDVEELSSFRCIYEYEDITYAALRDVVDNKVGELKQRRPLSKETVDEIDHHFATLVTWSSNAIEGNSLTRGETEAICKYLLNVTGVKSLQDVLDAANLFKAVGIMRNMVKNTVVSEGQFKEIHRCILWNTPDWAGKYRDLLSVEDQEVHIPTTTFQFPHATEVPGHMTLFWEWLSQNWDTMHPIDLAIEAHLRVVSIHPFRDGNGRSTRLLMNLILLSKGYPMSVIYPGYNDYYQDAVKRAQLGISNDKLLRICLEGVLDSVDYLLSVYV